MATVSLPDRHRTWSSGSGFTEERTAIAAAVWNMRINGGMEDLHDYPINYTNDVEARNAVAEHTLEVDGLALPWNQEWAQGGGIVRQPTNDELDQLADDENGVVGNEEDEEEEQEQAAPSVEEETVNEGEAEE